jgi:hypothetical protein
VQDPRAPNFSPSQPSVIVDSPQPTPAGARVFDSFSRTNSTYAFDGTGGLGSTEGGTADRQKWQYFGGDGSGLPFGILNGRAVVLANAPAGAWVSTGSVSSDLDISVNRYPGVYGGRSGISTGLVFRFRDPNNFFYAYSTGDREENQTLTVAYVYNSATTVLVSNLPMPASWTTLRVVTLRTGSINIYAGSTLVYSGSNSLLAAEKNAGLWSFHNGQGLSNRWDNFTVYDASP